MTALLHPSIRRQRLLVMHILCTESRPRRAPSRRAPQRTENSDRLSAGWQARRTPGLGAMRVDVCSVGVGVGLGEDIFG